MTDLDKMARELLAAEYERDGITHVADCIRREAMLTRIEHRSVRAIRTALLTAPPGYVLVPVVPTEGMTLRIAKALQASEQSWWTFEECSPVEVEGWMTLATAAIAAMTAAVPEVE